MAKADEMAASIFTPARLEQLRSQLDELRRGFSAEDDQEALAGVHGALMSSQATDAPEDNRFLVAVCWMSLRASMETMAQPPENGAT